MASNVPAPTPSPAAGTPQYTQSPAPVTTTSPPPSASISSELAGLGSLYPYSAASDLGIGMPPSITVGDDMGIPSGSADNVRSSPSLAPLPPSLTTLFDPQMDNIFASSDFGSLSTDETFDYHSWVHTNSFDAFPEP